MTPRAKIIVFVMLLLFGCADQRPSSDGGGLGDTGTANADGGVADAGGIDVGAQDEGVADVGRDDVGDESVLPPEKAMVNLSFQGCSPQFDGNVVVVENGDSIAVSATSGAALTGSVQLALQSERGVVSISTQHRIDTGAVINVIVGTTWTNISSDSPDPISGTLIVDQYQQSQGLMDITFQNVVLENVADGSLCEINGTLVTTGLSF